jgi:hypothetical protein
MSTPTRPGKGILIAYLVVLALLAGALIATALMWWLGDWGRHRGGLTLALRIVWGCWLVACLATVLTRVTIFSWYFRRYFRWPPGGEGAGPAPPAPPAAPRPARAPWYKSGKASFSITVVMVSLTGAAAVATAVLWILEDVTGPWVFWLVFRILWATWWVLVIAAVLTRVSIFRRHMKRAVRDEAPPQPPQGLHELAAGPPGRTGIQEQPPS